jgi:hypothetical protein
MVRLFIKERTADPGAGESGSNRHITWAADEALLGLMPGW